MASPKHDPLRYSAMVKPFDSMDATNEALTKFAEGLEALRSECGLADVLYVVSDSYIADGEALPFMVNGNLGDTTKVMPMAAWLFGRAQAEHEEMIARFAKPPKPGRSR